MTEDARTTCPKCGGRELRLIAEHQEDPGSFLGSAGIERAIIRVFQCRCGMAFTERDEDRGTSDSVL